MAERLLRGNGLLLPEEVRRCAALMNADAADLTAALASLVARSRFTVQADRLWSWALNTLRSASVSPTASVEVAAQFVIRAADLLTAVRRRLCPPALCEAAANRLKRCPFRSQRKAADLYTNALKPWLASLHLPWAGSAPEQFSPLAHVRWAASQPEALELATQVPTLLACYLSIERCARRNDGDLRLLRAVAPL